MCFFSLGTMDKTGNDMLNNSQTRIKKMYPIFIMLIALPLSMLFWVGNLAFARMWADQYGK